jgi:2-haloacid dehalogenase
MPAMTPPRWVTFDCFGTLVDWRHGIATSAELVAPGQGGRLLAAYGRHEAAVQEQHPAMRYREVLAETLRRACAEEGIRLTDDDEPVLATTLPYWPVFPEVGAELSALRAAGWNLALLTNCDRDLIALTRRRLPVPFDVVVTAEDVGAYKPALAHFEHFRSAHRPPAGGWVHVAQSYFHDIRPAGQLGIPRVWINRLAEPDDPALASAVQPDLQGLAGTVARLPG